MFKVVCLLILFVAVVGDEFLMIFVCFFMNCGSIDVFFSIEFADCFVHDFLEGGGVLFFLIGVEYLLHEFVVGEGLSLHMLSSAFYYRL